MWTVLARMPDRTIGGILPVWSGSLTLRFNEVGSWDITVPPETVPAGWLVPGAGVVFLRDGVPVASGMVDERHFEWTGDGGNGVYKLNGDTDLARIGYRIIYPNPEAAWEGDQVTAYYRYPNAAGNTDTAEEVMRVLVNDQCGSLALPARRVPGLTLGTPQVIGAQTRLVERFTPMLEALRSVASAGGGLAFDVVDDLNGAMLFTVREPVDLSKTARFGVELGNVRGLTVQESEPVGTVALVAGSGVKGGRDLSEWSIGTPGERREMFVDQRQVAGDTAAERTEQYEKAATEALEQAAEQSAVNATIADTVTVQWLRDFNLGDKVSVLTPFGQVTDIVRQVDIKVGEDGVEDVSSTIGTDNPRTDDPLAATVDRLLKRISQLERAL